MVDGKPLFPGKDHVNQFSIITDLLGTPPDDVIKTIGSVNVRSKLFGLSTNCLTIDILDPEICSILTKTRKGAIGKQIQERRSSR